DNWGCHTTQQPGLKGRTIYLLSGKVLGGSSAINAMPYVRATTWTFRMPIARPKLGATRSCLPISRGPSATSGPTSEYRGRTGPVTVLDYRRVSPVSHAFVETTSCS